MHPPENGEPKQDLDRREQYPRPNAPSRYWSSNTEQEEWINELQEDQLETQKPDTLGKGRIKTKRHLPPDTKVEQQWQRTENDRDLDQPTRWATHRFHCPLTAHELSDAPQLPTREAGHGCGARPLDEVFDGTLLSVASSQAAMKTALRERIADPHRPVERLAAARAAKAGTTVDGEKPEQD